MSLIKRKLERRRINNFDENLYEEIVKEIEFLKEVKKVKKSEIYKHLRKSFTERGFKPFQIMAHYQTFNILQKDDSLTYNEAYEQGVKIAAAIAAKRRR